MRRLLLALLLVASCGDSEPPRVNQETPIVYFDRGQIRVVTLPDGTQCAVLWQGSRGGIDCDWSDQ